MTRSMRHPSTLEADEAQLGEESSLISLPASVGIFEARSAYIMTLTVDGRLLTGADVTLAIMFTPFPVLECPSSQRTVSKWVDLTCSCMIPTQQRDLAAHGSLLRLNIVARLFISNHLTNWISILKPSSPVSNRVCLSDHCWC